jgi:RimJ/RimL family protein N-acetyltransferase
MHPLVRDWPLFGLRVRCADVELRLPDESDLAALADVARAGIHDAAVMPFSFPWTDAAPDDRARGVLQYQWSKWAGWKPEIWTLELAVVRAGVVVGLQALMAEQFAARRSVTTGSYLGLAHQGQGTGKLMRHAVLHLAFAGLGAREARSAALAGNEASHRVSRALGYLEDGTDTHSPRGVGVTATRYLLTRERWERAERPAVDIAGLEPCHAMFIGAIEPPTR